MSDVIRHVRLPVIGAEPCSTMYEKIASEEEFHISADMLCAGYDNGGMDACQVTHPDDVIVLFTK